MDSSGMTPITVEEFQWNLKRLLREGFPRGIPLDGFSDTYSQWLEKTVEPSIVGVGCKNWKRAFRVNDLLKKTFKITADKIPLVRLRWEGNEKSAEELRDVLGLVSYNNIFTIRFMRSCSAENSNNTDTQANGIDSTASTSTANGIASTATTTSANGILSTATTTTSDTIVNGEETTVTNVLQVNPASVVEATAKINADIPPTSVITVSQNSTVDSESVNDTTRTAHNSKNPVNTSVKRLILKIGGNRTNGVSLPNSPVVVQPIDTNNSMPSVHSKSKGGKRKTSENPDHSCSNNKKERLQQDLVIGVGQTNPASSSAGHSTEQRIDEIFLEDENESNSNVSVENENVKEATPGPSTSMGLSFSEELQDWLKSTCTECVVCHFTGCMKGNEMITCDSCKINVHKLCYGVQTIPSDVWRCQPCVSKLEVTCILCLNPGGAMKSVIPGNDWAHLVCATWIPEVDIECKKKMEPITNILNIPPERWWVLCAICKRTRGACIQCSENNCRTSYHVTCAFEKGLEMKSTFSDKNVKNVSLSSYCEKHSSKRRTKLNIWESIHSSGRPGPANKSVSNVPIKPKKLERLELSARCLRNQILVYPRFENKKKYLDGYYSQLQIVTTLHEVIPPRKSSALIFHGEKIYDIGGTTDLWNEWNADADASQSVDIFATGEGKITQSLRLVEPRKEFPVCICDDYMYAIGGYRGVKPIHFAERLELNGRPEGGTPQWESIRNMKLPRAGHDVAVLANKIYVIGGIGPVERGCQSVDCSSVMLHDPIRNTWSWVSPMKCSRRYVKAAVMNNLIYAVGGDHGEVIENASKDQSLMFSNRKNLSTVEVYCPERQTWSFCPDMNHSRSRGIVTVQDNLLFAIGGDCRVDPTVEVFDSRLNKWMDLYWPVNLPKHADLLTAITIST